MTFGTIDILPSPIRVGTAAVYLWNDSSHGFTEHPSGLRSLLSLEERKRAEAFHFDRDSMRYITAHALLRMVLSELVGQPPQIISFSKGLYGKPFLKNHSLIRFNMSHSGDCIAIAVAMDREVGIDVEKYKAFSGITDVARRIMTDKEHRYFQQLDKEARGRFFYLCWVRKEAAVKAWGRGIDEDLCRIPVVNPNSCEEAVRVYSYRLDRRKPWRIRDIDLDDDYFGALAIEEDTVSGWAENEV